MMAWVLARLQSHVSPAQICESMVSISDSVFNVLFILLTGWFYPRGFDMLKGNTKLLPDVIIIIILAGK